MNVDYATYAHDIIEICSLYFITDSPFLFFLSFFLKNNF